MSEQYDRLRADVLALRDELLADGKMWDTVRLSQVLEKHPAPDASGVSPTSECLHWLAHDIYAYVSECIDDEMDEWQENPDRIVGLIESVLRKRLGAKGEPSPPTPARATAATLTSLDGSSIYE